MTFLRLSQSEPQGSLILCQIASIGLINNVKSVNNVQGGTICGAIEGSSRSLKSIDKRVFINFRDKYAVFINFRDKNAVFTSFRDKNDVFELHDKNTVFGFNFVCSG